jgi:hypothetical protein
MFRNKSALPFPAYMKLAGLSNVSLGAFQVALIMNRLPCIFPPVPYWRFGSSRVRPSSASSSFVARPTLKTSSTYFL